MPETIDPRTERALLNLLSPLRLQAEGAAQASGPERSEYEVDSDRILFCDAFRRLQDKTQVHGPSGNDYVRSRLTHSLEVSRVGRQLGALAGAEITKRMPGFAWRPQDVGHVVSAACLMHDIGNPPYGHSGESSISSWFMSSPLGQDVRAMIKSPALFAEVGAFEGNAQGLRLVTRLQGWKPNGGLQLTAATLAAFCKYPFGSTSKRSAAKKGKYGFFATDERTMARAMEACGVERHPDGGWRRHMLAYLVEAADDTCYRIVDLEDAYHMNCLSFAEAEELLMSVAHADIDMSVYGGISRRSHRIEYLRARAIGALVRDVMATLGLDFDRVACGDHEGDLILAGQHKPALDEIERVSRARIYRSKQRLLVDLAGHQALTTILEAYLGAFLSRENGNASVRDTLLLRMFPRSEEVAENADSYVPVVLDYVSGMTDEFARRQAELLAQA